MSPPHFPASELRLPLVAFGRYATAGTAVDSQPIHEAAVRMVYYNTPYRKASTKETICAVQA